MFSLTSEYALKALVYLTQRSEDGPVPGRVIAAELDIPRKYLSAILRELVTSGVLDASPGRTGGFQLARDPKEVRLAEVLAPFERVIGTRPGCPFGNELCNDDDPCAGHELWCGLRDRITDFLNETSLFDVSIQTRGSRGQTAGRRG